MINLQDMHQLILDYGYWLMFFGALIEGETFLIAGGVAAQQGILHLYGLIALAFFGSTLHDCAFFFLGRYAGSWMLEKKWFSDHDPNSHGHEPYQH